MGTCVALVSCVQQTGNEDSRPALLLGDKDMVKASIVILMCLAGLPVLTHQESVQQFVNKGAGNPKPSISLAISARGANLDQRNQFKIGDKIIVAISMIDTSNQPVYACVSSEIYQDLPKLTRDGQPLQYTES